MDEQQDVSLESDIEQTNIETTEGQDPSDKLTPDHPRFKQVIEKNHELESTVENLRSEIAELKNSISSKQDAGEETTEDEQALRIIERRLSDKFATKDDLNSDRQALQFERLSGKYDGSNGYPKFVPVDVVAYAKRKGFGNNFESAYRDMHYDAILQTDIRNAGKAPTPPTSERPTGGERQTEGSVITPQDISQMTDEEYAKNREKILQAVKPK